MTGGSASFPSTHWSVLEAVRGTMSPQQQEALNCLIVRYWKPVYAYICRRDRRDEAVDLTQDFFVLCLQRELFGRADRARGRFRTFLLSCLVNFLTDVNRHRQRGGPPQGIVSVHQLARDDQVSFEVAEHETPEAVFCRTWVFELLHRVRGTLEEEFSASGKQTHCELFRQRVFEPALTGAQPPSLSQLAQDVGLEEKQASNHIVTAVRAFRRLLREEIRVYASSEEEVASEIRDLFQFATKP